MSNERLRTAEERADHDSGPAVRNTSEKGSTIVAHGPTQDGAAEREDIRPLKVLGLWSIGLVGAYVLTDLLVTISDALALYSFDRARGMQQLGEQQSGPGPWLAGVWLVVAPTAAAVFITWLWRARRNSELLCAARHSRSIGWVVGATRRAYVGGRPVHS